MPNLILLNKPFNCLSQFTDKEQRQTLADLFPDANKISGYYPAGRLDYDSEGLLLLTNSGVLQNRITSPALKMAKTYWVQVEGLPSPIAIAKLERGVMLKDGLTKPAKVKMIATPNLWERSPAVRYRAEIPTHWLEISITEGRNRQVRRMTAEVGLPTLRLVRASIGHWSLANILPGEFVFDTVHLPKETIRSPRGRK
ncbi:pseudouridine synthase [Teredinibacter waterburyi]|jgi:ribosomal large subunit pseudouridine synthase E (EC 5.4.99.-)|uniref:pseudouridine synthase n=1 Tax=Teredinibacter waterburyi TaxID=1500538 RepID=UPI00165F62C6|nr:pseudouridine synthase [Teredinibacter waterburyi]